jgi:translation initiation factor 3 subunit I
MTELFPQNPVRNINACRFNPLISSEDEKVVKYHAFIAGGQESREVTTTASKKGGFETIIYDCMYGEELGAIQGHFGPVNALAVSSDGELLASGSEESSIRVHRMNNDEYNNLERK